MPGSLRQILTLPRQQSQILQQNKKHAVGANLPLSWRRHLHHIPFTHEDELSLGFVIIACIIGNPNSTFLGLFLQKVVVAVEGVDQSTAPAYHAHQVGLAEGLLFDEG